MGNPIFRFTLSHEPDGTVAPFPELSEWLNLGDGAYPWTLGASPTVNLPGTVIPLNIAVSDYLYTPYAFIAGFTYTITLNYTAVHNSGSSVIRRLRLTVFDDDFATIFTATESWPSAGGSGTVSITFTANSDCTNIGVNATSLANFDVTIDSLGDVPEPVGRTQEISEPEGWMEAVSKLERHEEYHSLIEYFEGAFIFYGSDGRGVDGGIDFIKSIELEYGPDATIEILIEVSFDSGISYEDVFDGQLDLEGATEFGNNKKEVPIIRDDFWSKFINRKATPVDLMATVDLDDQAITPFDSVRLALPSQKIRYNGSYNWLDSVDYDYALGNHVYTWQLDWEETVTDDLKKFTLPRVIIEGGASDYETVVGLFEAPFDGVYTFDVKLTAASYVLSLGEWRQITSSVQFYLHLDGESPGPASEFTNNSVGYSPDSVTEATFNKSLRLLKGQQIVVYGQSGAVTSGPLPKYTVFGQRRLTYLTDVDLASTGTVVLSGEHTLDGVLTSTSRVLLKNQGNPEENGIWNTGAGAWTRAADADTAAEMLNVAVYVLGGDTQTDTAWRQTEDDFVINVDANSWVFLIPSKERTRPYPGTEVENYFRVTADTTFKSSQTHGFLLHDTLAAILQVIGLGNCLYSDMLGSAYTNARQYDEDGCAWRYFLTRGLQIRGYSLDDKPFAIAVDDWWRGANPILNLGLGYDIIPGGSTSGTTVEPVADWTNAGGPNPGSWTYTSPSVPHASINGGGGVQGYTKGAAPTVAGESYAFQYTIEIGDTGSSDPISVVTVALLDASDNEVATLVFNYTTEGIKTESFSLSPSSDGVSVAVRIQNDTPVDTKNYYIQEFTTDEIIVTEDLLVMRVEEKSYFYHEEISTNLDYCELEIQYDEEVIFNKVDIGYAQWEAEDISGIDDPQTKHTYATRFKKIGKGIELFSEFVAASLAIEATRRQTINVTTDYKFDNNTFIISINPNDVSPDSYRPELNENFDSVTNLLNSESRYNLRLTPARNLLRWLNYINISLQSYLSSVYRFVAGQGNYDMASEMVEFPPDADCDRESFDGEPLSEKQNIPVTRDHLHTHQIYTIRGSMTWEQYNAIRNNRRNGVGVSQTDTGHKLFFIKELSFELTKSKFTMRGWPKEYFAIEQINFTPIMDCSSLVPDIDVNDAFDYDLDFDL